MAQCSVPPARKQHLSCLYEGRTHSSVRELVNFLFVSLISQEVKSCTQYQHETAFFGCQQVVIMPI